MYLQCKLTKTFAMKNKQLDK